MRPEKPFERIGARQPIVAVCPPHSEMGSVLERHRGDVCFVGLEMFDVSASLTAPLHRSEQAAQLLAIFEGPIERGRVR